MVGVLVVVMVFEAVRRVLGIALPIICGLFLLYGLFGEHLPGVLAHRPFGYDQVIAQLYLGTEGIYGMPTLVSATYIFLFILFGSFLEHAGMIRLFNNVALGLVGSARGGPAKVAVISSGFMGTISGSGVANVLTVGQFTIPLMKRFGYSAKFAGAVEATSSMGGQIMPPVMGAVAFIMAETLNLPYVEICKAAVIPAVLYYVTAFWMVHLEAGRMGLMGLPRDQLPNAWHAIRDNWYLLLPLVALVVMLFDGFTPMFAGMAGLALTSMLILGASIAATLGSTALRYFFWIALGVAAATFVKWGVMPVIGVHRAPRGRELRRPRRSRDASHDALGPRRRRQAGAARRPRLRDRGRHHRRAHAHRRGEQLRRLHPGRGREEPLPVALPHDDRVPDPRHGHPHDPELHHHQLHRGARAAQARRAAARVAHVRLLLRHHGRPHAAGGARRARRRVDRQGVVHEDRHEGDADRDRRLRDPLHGGLRSRRS